MDMVTECRTKRMNRSGKAVRTLSQNVEIVLKTTADNEEIKKKKRD